MLLLMLMMLLLLLLLMLLLLLLLLVLLLLLLVVLLVLLLLVLLVLLLVLLVLLLLLLQNLRWTYHSLQLLLRGMVHAAHAIQQLGRIDATSAIRRKLGVGLTMLKGSEKSGVY